jgi:hypothetical protein
MAVTGSALTDRGVLNPTVQTRQRVSAALDRPRWFTRRNAYSRSEWMAVLPVLSRSYDSRAIAGRDLTGRLRHASMPQWSPNAWSFGTRMLFRWSLTACGATPSADGLRSTVIAFVLTLSGCTSAGRDVSLPVNAPPSASFAAAPFYIEFRTWPYFTITHTFQVYGAQDPSCHPLELKSVGFYPHGGAFGPFIGIVGITGEVGDEGYYASLPSSTTYHRNLTAEQHLRLTRYIDAEQAEPQIYNLLFNNCNDLVAGAANAIGLKVPFLHALPPPLFIVLCWPK